MYTIRPHKMFFSNLTVLSNMCSLRGCNMIYSVTKTGYKKQRTTLFIYFEEQFAIICPRLILAISPMTPILIFGLLSVFERLPSLILNCRMLSLAFIFIYSVSLTRIHYPKLYSLAHLFTYECLLCSLRT